MKNETYIGRAKTVLVSGEGSAAITDIIAKTVEEKNSQKLYFSGSVNFDEPVKDHIRSTILYCVNQIGQSLKIPIQSFEISAVNIGASSSSDIGLSIAGFSADVSIFIAMLSASMKLPLEQHILFTGHIASKEGDISQEKLLGAKSEAAVIDKGVSTFVFPSLESDSSLEILKPKEFENSISAIKSCRGKIRLIAVQNTLELIRKTLSDESIVLSSFNCNFFRTKFDEIQIANHEPLLSFFLEDNTKRYWKSLEYRLINKNVKKNHLLLNAFVDYHIRMKKYPSNFGRKLNELVLSLPYSVKKKKELFPLIKKDKFIQMIHHAKENDHDDISELHKVLYESIEGKIKFKKSLEEVKVEERDESDRLDYILDQINPDFIDLHITKPIDEARASYVIENIQAENYDNLLNTITAFFIHIYRHTNNHLVDISNEKFNIEALELFKNTFPKQSEFKEAVSIALNGNKGGLRYILDMIAKYLKKETRDKHIFAIINDAINPLDYELKKRLIEKIMDREKDRLKLNHDKMNAEQYVENYIAIIQEYAQSKNSLNRIFKIY
ncbi:MAG: hypothetical protein PHW27_06795 [Melioribacteraceae bacterium]|nr:hypothetical protein [Melioribacteraceae bacterium]